MIDTASELALLQTVCDATRLLIIVTDVDGQVLRLNRAAEDALNRTPADGLGSIRDLAALSDEKELLRGAFASPCENLPTGMLFHLTGPKRCIVDWTVTVQRHDARDTVVVFAGMDLTDRERDDVRVRSQNTELLAREQRARRETEEANVRLVLIAEAGKALAGSLRFRDTLDIFSRLVTPSLADWCLVVFRREQGELGRSRRCVGDPRRPRELRRGEPPP